MATILLIPWLIPAPVQADGGEVLWMFQGIEDIQTMAWLPDVDGDLVPDIVIETYDAGASGDHLYVVSGGDSSTPAVIWSARPESGVSNGGGYGDKCLSVCPDLSGDRFPDVLLGTAWGNRSVHALDGRTGDLLWTFDTYDEAYSGWIYSVAPHPDRNADGVPEVIAAAGSDADSGYLLDGATGQPIWRFTAAADALSVALSLPDVNFDGVSDVLFCAIDNDDRIYCVSGAGEGIGQLIWSEDTGGSNYTATVCDDVTGDAIGDIVIGNWTASQQIQCRDAVTGANVWTFNNGSYNYAMRVVMLSDVNDDGARDVAVGSWDRAVKVVCGRTGDLLWLSYAGTLNGGDFWSVDRLDDVNGDGFDEVVGGSFDNNVYLFSGADGDTLWMYNTSRRLYTVRGGPDLSGNQVADVLAGTQYLNWGGRAFALEGADDPTAVNTPQVTGRATFSAAADGVELRWSCSRDLPFNVYRVRETKGRAADRQRVVSAFERGALRSRDVISTILADQADVTLLNPEPIQPFAADDGCLDAGGAGPWCYAFSDLSEAGDPSCRTQYLLSACLPGGGEIMLAELQPAVAAVPSRVLRSASIRPNPFNPTAQIVFELGNQAPVALDVHDLLGRKVDAVPARTYTAGVHTIRWPRAGRRESLLASGVYVVTVSTPAETIRIRAVLVR